MTPDTSVRSDSVVDLCVLAARLSGAESARLLLAHESRDAAPGERSVPITGEDGTECGTLLLAGAPEMSAEVASSVSTVATALATALEVEDLRSEAFDASERAARSEETLSEAAGQLVHDVNNPLAAASMALEIARDEVEEGLVAQLLDRAVNSTTRMKRMVTDLLAFSAPHGPGNSSLSEVLVPLAQAYRETGALEVTVPESDAVLPLRRGDLEVVLVCLLDNAVTFALDEPRAQVLLSRGEESVRVEVADAGRGVPPEDRERIFVPTVRLDRRIPGMGLGLASVRRLVESAGGHVGAQDSALGGVSVWFELPVGPQPHGR